MNEYGMNEFEMIKKADVMRIINEENAVVLNNLKERSTDEVLCAIASQINGLQTTAKSGGRLIDADAFSEQCGNYYAEEGPEEGFIGTVGELIAKQPTVESDIDRAAIMRLCNEIEMIIVTVCDTGYTLQSGDVEAIMKRTKAIKKELTGDAKTD
jgi:hypothetical protein